jgi:hypothetical protein
MPFSFLASLAGAATLILIAGCGRPPEAAAVQVDPVAATSRSSPATQGIPGDPTAAPPPARTDEALASASEVQSEVQMPAPRKRGGGAFGIGIRPTGSGANGITR